MSPLTIDTLLSMGYSLDEVSSASSRHSIQQGLSGSSASSVSSHSTSSPCRSAWSARSSSPSQSEDECQLAASNDRELHFVPPQQTAGSQTPSPQRRTKRNSNELSTSSNMLDVSDGSIPNAHACDTHQPQQAFRGSTYDEASAWASAPGEYACPHIALVPTPFVETQVHRIPAESPLKKRRSDGDAGRFRYPLSHPSAAFAVSTHAMPSAATYSPLPQQQLLDIVSSFARHPQSHPVLNSASFSSTLAGAAKTSTATNPRSQFSVPRSSPTMSTDSILIPQAIPIRGACQW